MDAARIRRHLERRIRRLVLVAKLSLFWERLWPALWPALALVCVFTIFALFGLIGLLPVTLHWVLLFALAGGGLFLLWHGLKDVRWPRHDEALRRIEEDSRLPHQPLSVLEDMPAAGTGSATLWKAHQERVQTLATRLRTGWPSPGLAAGDPWALRAALGLILIIALFGTPEGRWQRVREALLPGLADVKPMRIEAWLTPPAYTGVAPVYLSGIDPDSHIRVPVRSVLSVRVDGSRAMPNLNAIGPGRADVTPPGEFRLQGEANYALDYAVTGTSEIRLVTGGRVVAQWNVAAIPDKPPVIAFTKPLSRTASGALRFAYTVTDDYGVADARAEIALAETPGQPGGPNLKEIAAAAEAGSEAMRGLLHQPVARVEPPAAPLDMPGSGLKTFTGTTVRDLAAHPWAGLPVTITLVARDAAGQEGRSQTVRLLLPERPFNKPLAQAVIEQRRRLVLEPTARFSVSRALNDVTKDAGSPQDPELYIQDTTAYLALRAGVWRLVFANRDEDLDGIYDLLWSAALHIEDGDLSLAEQALKEAQDRLKQAIERGAPPAEIKELMAGLRAALQRYFEAAKASGKSPQTNGQTASPGTQTITEAELQQMMQAIADALASGDEGQARQLMAQLRNILENLQPPAPGQLSPAQSAMQNALGRTGDLIKGQQQLMDRTFQGGPPADASGKTAADALSRQMNALGQTQKALRQELQDIAREMGEKGAPAPEGFGQAGQAMESAEKEIADGRTDRAVSQQGKALDGLKQAAQSLASELARSGAGGAGQAGGDPMGRPLSGQGADGTGDVAVPDHIDAQKARQILEELRRRAAEVGRPKIELDYIDRLLNQF
ncbi:MAG: TIGR02302 family protein [Parvibaculaceae bacterium]|nr:TIGR02302 family protein [Parvibaculaceae bacterium]